MNALPASIAPRIGTAIALIGSVPGYEAQAATLGKMLEAGRIRFVPTLEDRAQASLTGVITLGGEPFASGATTLGLAETLVHELFHRMQNPLLKSSSFWAGVFTRSDVMLRYERPAYRAAERFIAAYLGAFPEANEEAASERHAVRATFESSYGEPL